MTDRPETTILSLSQKIALKLKDEYSIGTFSRFCDEPPDFDPVDLDDLSETIQGVINAK